MGKSILILLLLSMLNNHNKKKPVMEKYEWLATTCASFKYPMQIVKGNFLLQDDDTLKIQGGSMLYNGWGSLGSIYILGDKLKSLPKAINLTWFSITEDKFFSCTADLPVDKIKTLFSQTFTSPITSKPAVFRNIIVGLAPNGTIVLWVSGDKVTKEVCILKALEDKDIKWNDYISNPDYPRKKYLKLKLEDVFAEKDLLALAKNGVDTELYSNKYRQHYYWQPFVACSIKPLTALLYYYNGETEYSPVNDLAQKEERPVPSKLKIAWLNSKNNKFSAEIIFDEAEAFSSFEKFSGIGDGNNVKMQIEITDSSPSVSVFLRNDTHVYPYKNCKIQVFQN